MHIAQLPYRELLEQMDDCEDGALEPLIKRWLKAHPPELGWIEELAKARANQIPGMAREDLWRLYALSRVSDALITLSGKAYGRTQPYISFMEGLGLQRTPAVGFQPFFHEVVSVNPCAIPDADIKIAGVLWPGFMCGPLMVARAGVVVAGGAMHVRKGIAETSTLYWSYRRAGRPTEDLSRGWGHNSQWRTTFRRDYLIGDEYHYNVDGDNNPGDPVLEEHERLELLRHRCFIVTERGHANLYPYELRHSEPMV